MSIQNYIQSYSISLNEFKIVFNCLVDLSVQKNDYVSVFINDKIIFEGYAIYVSDYQLVLKSYFSKMAEMGLLQ